MPRNSPITGETLLNRLLDRHEEPQERVRDITQRIEYKRVGGPAEQDNLHRVLCDAEGAGGVRLERDRLARFTGEIARVRLVDATALYRFLNRLPATTIAETAGRKVKAACPDILRDQFFEAVVSDAVAAWSANRRFLDFAPADTENFVTVLRLAHGITHWTGRDIDHRTFSRKTVKDSKALERNEGRVASLLRRWNPSVAGVEPREILQACGIVRRAHPLFLRGPITIESDTMKLEGSGIPFVGLPWSSVQATTLSAPVDYVIIVENPTSFWRYCMEIEGLYCALLSDGFPARDALAGIVHIVRMARSLRPTPIFLWGDIDAGGLRIAAHLEDACGVPLKLHDMTPALARKLGGPLRSRSGLERLATRDGDVGALTRWLLSQDGQALEQEELDPRPPLSALRRPEPSQ